MANVVFKKGKLATLPNTYSAGTFYVTTDERAMYLDISDEARIRLGDFQEFASVTELAKNANPNTTALYYVSDINCLAKWNGAEYVQINKDTGYTSFSVEGEGNAITAITVDSEDKRKLVLTKGATYMTSADVDTKIDTKVGSLKIGETTYDTVVAYVNKKAEDTLAAAQGGSSETASSVKQALDNYKTENDAKVEANKTAADNAQKAADEAKTAADAAQATADSKVTMAEVEAKDYATKAEAQGYADGKDTAIAEAKKAGTDAQTAVDALSEKVGTVTEGKTVVEMIADAQTAATYDDAAIKGRVKAIEDDYLKATDKTELANSIADVKSDVDTFLASADIGGDAIDTLKELQDYINTHGEAAATLTTKVGNLETTVGKAAEGETPATGLVKSVADNAAAITAERTRAEGKEAKLEAADTTNLQAAKDYADEKITDLSIGDYAKKADLTTLSDKVTADEVIINKLNGDDTVDGSVSKALKDAKAYADGLSGNYDANGSAATAEQNAKDYADGLADNYDAKGSATTAETNAKNYADGLASNYDAKGSATTAETNAKAYADSLLVWGEF